MAFTRRELCALFPVLVATSTGYAADKAEPNGEALPSAIYNSKKLSAKGDKDHVYMPMFEGHTSSGLPVELHVTELAPGGVVHGIRSHPGDELFLVREGVLEVEFGGTRYEVGAGSVAYVASNTPYAVRNTSKEWARYFVFLFDIPRSSAKP
jgi:quercetin dioxygenase-like cupin family protein